jgi:hypothetical protein
MPLCFPAHRCARHFAVLKNRHASKLRFDPVGVSGGIPAIGVRAGDLQRMKRGVLKVEHRKLGA